MNSYVQRVSLVARKAVQAKDWAQVKVSARQILNRHRDSAEGHFLVGLYEKASNRPEQAVRAFTRALSLDDSRYDAAVELAGQFLRSHRYGEAATLLKRYESCLDNSPVYLDMAGTIYTNIGLPEKGWPLYRLANELQPGVNSLQANFAASNVYVGKIDEAQDIYRQLLQQFPNHQRNHYELSRLGRAADSVHIDQMKGILRSSSARPAENIYMYYALGKELEDLGQWEDAFAYYKKAGDAAASVADYDVKTDISLIDKIVEVCDSDWLARKTNSKATDAIAVDDVRTPIFIVGLPRTGSTLTERILSSHSRIESIGESYFMQIVLKQQSRVEGNASMSSAIIQSASRIDSRQIASAYLEAIAYRLGDQPMFIEKYPENFLYLGFIAKAFPHARIVHLNRNPMDTCFAMYKQSFFRYAYTLDDLGPYYVAYQRLLEHWRHTLKDRLIEIEYESLVSDQDKETHKLLKEVGVEFEDACLNFEQNKTASNTASTVQIREKIHTRSVNRWKYFEKQLQPLEHYLESAGIKVA